MACGILVHYKELNQGLVTKVPSSNHLAAREFPKKWLLDKSWETQTLKEKTDMLNSIKNKTFSLKDTVKKDKLQNGDIQRVQNPLEYKENS